MRTPHRSLVQIRSFASFPSGISAERAGVHGTDLFDMTKFYLHPYLLMPLLVYISWHDIQTMEIPDAGWILISLFALAGRPSYFWAIAVFTVLSLFSIAGLLGFGDVKLTAAMALLIGMRILAALQIASSLALLFFLVKKGTLLRIPFAPFLCLGFAVFLFC